MNADQLHNWFGEHLYVRALLQRMGLKNGRLTKDVPLAADALCYVRLPALPMSCLGSLPIDLSIPNYPGMPSLGVVPTGWLQTSTRWEMPRRTSP